jgi:hypothetical protein
MMLLIDGIKYKLWTPEKEDDLERMVKEHAKDIFGNESLYLDLKQKLKSKAGIGSIPDGYIISFEDKPRWHIVEVELSSHPLYEHIVPQITRFTSGITNPHSQKVIIDAIDEEIRKDEVLKVWIKSKIGSEEIHRFLSNLISSAPTITIIIDEKTDELEEVCHSLPGEKRIVEFKTFEREGVGLGVHAHLFEPLVKPSIGPPPPPPEGKARPVTFQELANAGLVKDGQILCFYHTKLFTDEQGQIIVSSNKLKYKADGKIYSVSELAKKLLIKHGFKHNEHGVQGPKYWKTEDAKLLDDLNEQLRSRRGDRK